MITNEQLLGFALIIICVVLMGIIIAIPSEEDLKKKAKEKMLQDFLSQSANLDYEALCAYKKIMDNAQRSQNRNSSSYDW